MNDELHDPELASILGRASGAFPDVNVAFESVRGRVRQAKRRRIMVVSSAACALLIAGGVIAVQASGGKGGGTSVADTPTVVVETSKITDETTESSEVTEATEATTPESSEPESSEPETTEAAAPSTSEDHHGSSGGSAGSSSNSGSESGPSSSQGSGSTVSTATTVATSTKPQVPTGEHTVPSEGGSVTYRLDGGGLTLVKVVEADGWTSEVVNDDAAHLRVEFTDAKGDTTWRIEIRTEGGKTPIETSRHG